MHVGESAHLDIITRLQRFLSENWGRLYTMQFLTLGGLGAYTWTPLRQECKVIWTIRSPRLEGTDVGAFLCTNFVHNGCVGGHNFFFFMIFHILVLNLGSTLLATPKTFYLCWICLKEDSAYFAKLWKNDKTLPSTPKRWAIYYGFC